MPENINVNQLAQQITISVQTKFLISIRNLSENKLFIETLRKQELKKEIDNTRYVLM